MKKILWFIVLLVVSVVGVACGGNGGNEVVEVEGYEYNADVAGFYTYNEIMIEDVWEQEEDVYMVYFHTPVCPYCVQFKDTLEEYEEKENAFEVYKLNVDIERNAGVWKDYQLQGTPSLYVMDRENNMVIDGVVGAVALEDIPVK